MTKSMNLLEQVVKRLPDLSLWDVNMHLSHHGKLVIENRLPGAAHRIVNLCFQRDTRGPSLTAYAKNYENASVMIPTWSHALALSLLLASLSMETMSKEDMWEVCSLVWSTPKVGKKHGRMLKMLQAALFKSIVYSQGSGIDPIKYPDIIASSIRLLRHRYLGFEKDDVNKTMEKLREKFAFLANKGIEEEDIITAWRESAIVGHVQMS